MTRTEPRVFEDGQEIICGDCQTYERAEASMQKEVDELKKQVDTLQAEINKARHDWLEKMHDARGVREPCTMCGGTGVRAYPSTSTWRGGIGGAAITWDVCDVCWGSGDAERKWVNLREQNQDVKQKVAARAEQLLARRAGCSAKTLRPELEQLVDVIEKQGRKRKVSIWYRGACSAVANTLREAMDAGQKQEGKS